LNSFRFRDSSRIRLRVCMRAREIHPT
jgi:hypothetical protein